MFANERQNQIFEMVQNKGAISTGSLVEEFGVSIETIRRDLLAMEQKGKLTRVHGGAVAKTNTKPFFSLQKRNKENISLKNCLSKKAADFVLDGDTIAIDAGSTAIAFAEALKEKHISLTVVTYSLDVFHILSPNKNFCVILCGGYYMENENAFYGALTIDTLQKIHVQKAFICPSAVSLKGGICDYQNDLFQIQEKLFECSDEIYILADSSKFEKKALLKHDDMKTEYTYVTDSDLSEELQRIYKKNNINIFI